MAKLIPYLMLAAIHWMVLNGSMRILKMVYRPYGPFMCRELCEESEECFTYNKEDLSCRQIQATTSGIVGNRTSDDSITCLKGRNKLKTSMTVTARHDNSEADYKGLSPTQSPSPSSLNLKQQMTTEAPYSVDQIDDPVRTLHQACQKGNMSVVQFILSKKLADINCLNHRRRRPVMAAAGNGQVRVLQYLVIQGCDMSARDNSGNNVLHIACRSGSLAVVKELIIKDKYDVDSRGPNAHTPVLIAALKGYKGIVKFLVSQHCNIKAVDKDGNSILHLACIGGQIDLVKYVYGFAAASLARKNDFGATPYGLAKYNRHEEVLTFLKAEHLK